MGHPATSAATFAAAINNRSTSSSSRSTAIREGEKQLFHCQFNGTLCCRERLREILYEPYKAPTLEYKLLLFLLLLFLLLLFLLLLFLLLLLQQSVPLLHPGAKHMETAVSYRCRPVI